MPLNTRLNCHSTSGQWSNWTVDGYHLHHWYRLVSWRNVIQGHHLRVNPRTSPSRSPLFCDAHLPGVLPEWWASSRQTSFWAVAKARACFPPKAPCSCRLLAAPGARAVRVLSGRFRWEWAWVSRLGLTESPNHYTYVFLQAGTLILHTCAMPNQLHQPARERNHTH